MAKFETKKTTTIQYFAVSAEMLPHPEQQRQHLQQPEAQETVTHFYHPDFHYNPWTCDQSVKGLNTLMLYKT